MRKEAEKLFFECFEGARQRLEEEGDFVARDTLERIKNHSLNVARVAEGVAGKCGMDADEAYAVALLHDIGKTCENWRGLDHAILGYKLLRKAGLETAARVALTHTWYGYDEIDWNDFWARMRMDDAAMVQEFFEENEMTDLDKLVQLADNMAQDEFVTTVTDRFCDILARHNLKHAGEHIRALYVLKQYFDQKCGFNIYELFKDDIIESTMKEPNEAAGVESSSDYEGDKNEI